ncbi:MAG: 3-hydroxyacyl-ACP dehydratase FabZ family protein [Candidatus Anammoxibacter sp.]
MRFVLIDKILEYEKGKSAVGVKDVTMTEDFLADHFPKFPVMPGVLQLESVLQLVSWLVFVTKDFSVKTKVINIKGVKYSGFVRPGDKMIIKVDITSIDDKGVEFKAKVFVDDKVKSSVKAGTLSFVNIEELEDPEEAKAFFRMLTQTDK